MGSDLYLNPPQEQPKALWEEVKKLQETLDQKIQEVIDLRQANRKAQERIGRL